MIEEEVTIVAVEEDYALVQAAESGACGHCSANQVCGTASLQKWLKRQPQQLRVPIDKQAYDVGEQVVIGIPEHAVLSGSIKLYLLPLLALIAGAIFGSVVAGRFFPAHEETAAIVAGIASMWLSYRWLSRHLHNLQHKDALQPVILRKSRVLPTS